MRSTSSSIADAKRSRSAAKPRRASSSRTNRFAGPSFRSAVRRPTAVGRRHRRASGPGRPRAAAHAAVDAPRAILSAAPRRTSSCRRRPCRRTSAASCSRWRVGGTSPLSAIGALATAWRRGGCARTGRGAGAGRSSKSADPRQCRQPARLEVHRRQGKRETRSGKPVLLEPAERLLLDSPPGAAPRTALRRRRREAVDDRCDRPPAAVSQRFKASRVSSTAIGSASVTHAMWTWPGRAAGRPSDRPAPSMLSISASAASGVQPPRSAFDHDPVLALHPIEHLRQPLEHRRHRQHPQQVAGRRGVDDDVQSYRPVAAKSASCSSPAISSIPGSDSRSSRATSSRSSQVPRNAISSSSPRRSSIHASSAAVASTSTASSRATPRTRRGRRAKRLLERVAERRRRVGRDNERPVAGAGGEHAHGRRARRLADAALASDEPECGNG